MISGSMMLLAGGCGINRIIDCSAVDLIKPSRADVLTRGTKEQIVKHNTWVEANCR